MPKFKIKTNATHKFGQTNQVPYAGKIVFDSEGNVEVDVRDEAELDKLFAAVPDLFLPATKTEEVKVEPHTITQEDLKVNPELKEAGVEVGEVIGLPLETQVEVNDLGVPADAGNDIGKPDNDQESTEELQESLESPLDSMNIQELRNLALTSGFPEAEWKEFTKVPLRAYLKAKVAA